MGKRTKANYTIKQRAKSTNLFKDLKELEKNVIKPRTLRPKNVLSLEHDKEAIGLVRDIIEELQIMIHILELQGHALKATRHRHLYIWEHNLGESKQTLEALSQQAKDIHEMVGQAQTLMRDLRLALLTLTHSSY